MIMDGNRRWAKRHGLATEQGHEQGVQALREIVRYAVHTPLARLSVYGFSLDNWQRSAHEVDALMRLVRMYIRGDLAELHQHQIRLQFLGRRDNMDADLLGLIDEAEHLTQANQAMVLAIAFNYGGRDEIVRAHQQVLARAQTLNLENIDKALANPAVDLLIRTGGEQRLSDFLLWQSAYAELVFVKQLWPDFTPAHFAEAIEEYIHRDRRFGADSLLEKP